MRRYRHRRRTWYRRAREGGRRADGRRRDTALLLRGSAARRAGGAWTRKPPRPRRHVDRDRERSLATGRREADVDRRRVSYGRRHPAIVLDHDQRVDAVAEV